MMARTRLLVVAAAVLAVAVFPCVARAQYGGTGTGSALSSDAMMHQGVVHAGIDDMNRHVEKETPFKILKDVKLGLKDADPNVRVQELKKLRTLQDPDVNKILIQSLSDPDIRVKVKAVDLLGAREANEAVAPMSQMLFLRSTDPFVKLHVVAALGRIGDARGAVPVMQYLDEREASADNDDAAQRARGTAVFALGEIGSENANQTLSQIVSNDKSEMVRRLAQEALQKIDGELPTQHSSQRTAELKRTKVIQPTDEKLAKLRAFDAKMQQMER